MKLGPWEPDNAAMGGANMATCRNVYAAASGYRPVKSMTEFADAISGEFKGAASFLATDGAARLLAGSGTDLYSLVAGSWTSVLDTLSVYTRWRFVQFGNFAVCTYGGAPVEVDLGANTAGDLAGSPPDADLCAVVRDFVVLGRCDGDETLITWSGFNDHTSWTAGTDMSGYQPMLTGGRIMGVTGGERGLILQRDRIVLMSYTGDVDAPFQFDEVSTNYGCVAEGSVAQAGNVTFCYSRRGFIKIEAGAVSPIGVERVDKTFRDTYTMDDLGNIWATVDPERTLVVWTIYGRQWCYNWTLDRWTDWLLPADAAFQAFSESTSIDALDALFSNLDSVPYSLDDPRFSGGEPRLIMVGRDGTFNVLNGPNMAAEFTTSPQEPFQGVRARINRVRPVCDAIEGVKVTIGYSQRLGDGNLTAISTDLRASGDMPLRCSGRYITPTLEIAEGVQWTIAQALEFPDMVASGAR